MKIKLIKSPIGRPPSTQKTLSALGLKRINQTIEIKDEATHMGMFKAISHMVKVLEK